MAGFTRNARIKIGKTIYEETLKSEKVFKQICDEHSLSGEMGIMFMMDYCINEGIKSRKCMFWGVR